MVMTSSTGVATPVARVGQANRRNGTGSVAYYPRVRTQTLAGDIAHLLHRVVFDKKRFDVPDLPPVVGGSWGNISLEGLWGPLRTEGPTLIWEPSLRYPAAEAAKANSERLRMLRNAPSRLELADGRRIVSRLGDTPKWGARGAAGPGPTCEFVEWNTEGGRPVVRWVARLKGGGLPAGNLHMFAGSRLSPRNLRLEGAHTWYLLEVDQKEDLVVVVDGGPSPLDVHALGIDFSALQVALGSPLQLDVLVGFDGPGNVVGADEAREVRERRRRKEGERGSRRKHQCVGGSCWQTKEGQEDTCGPKGKPATEKGQPFDVTREPPNTQQGQARPGGEAGALGGSIGIRAARLR